MHVMTPGQLHPDPAARLDGQNGHDLQTTVHMLIHSHDFFSYGYFREIVGPVRPT